MLDAVLGLCVLSHNFIINFRVDVLLFCQMKKLKGRWGNLTRVLELEVVEQDLLFWQASLIKQAISMFN